MNDLQKTIITKQKVLEEVRKQLKKEFIGIDKIIDQIINLCSSWFLLPSLQDKPVVINLWGLTGVGKSSLINRLAELLNYSSKYYHFTIGNKSRLDISNQMEDIYENGNKYPLILAFDEFQHAKTCEYGRDIENPKEKIVWELLDSGKFIISRYNRDVETIYELKSKLDYALSKGVKVQNGKVIFNKKLYYKIAKLEDDFDLDIESKTDLIFFPEYRYDILFDLDREHFNSIFQMKQKLMKLDGRGTILFLEKLLEYAISPKTIDCSKAIIFILGNLDEAYTMSNNYNADMEADEFHKQSLKINISDIKNTLRLKFRNEHIARLGNNHIIYPAFSSNSFKKIINLELTKIAEKIEKSYHIKLFFSKPVKQLIYKEGVYPTQGTRPIYTTIHQLITSKLGTVVTQIYLNSLDVDFILLKTDKNRIFFDYYCKKKLIFNYSEKLILNLSKLRINRKDDTQAITAVHESGHAILTAILLKILPEVIYSVTADSEISGFIYSNFKWKYISRKEIIPRLAAILGGYAAEELIFGKDYLTSGAESDIDKATNFISDMYKNSGMGDLPISYKIPEIEAEYYYHNYKPLEEEIKEVIEQALNLAKITLQKEKTLLLKMADYLSDNRMLKKNDIENIVNTYATTPVNFITNGALLYYRKHLKNLVVNDAPVINDKIETSICLNKETIKMSREQIENH